MIVSGSGQQIVGKGLAALDAGLMKGFDWRTELLGAEAHVIARQQHCRTIERRVFHRFRRSG
ncbi:hypothetical protein D3C84_1041480 [compost metagenome]